MEIDAIVAMSQNRVIGHQQGLPWNLPEDLKRFRQLTWGHPIIMGRKTFDSLKKPLPGRENWVISHQQHTHWPKEVLVFQSISDAIHHANQQKKQRIFFIGGATIYEQAYPWIQRLFLTLIHQDFSGDTFFPSWPGFLSTPTQFTTLNREDHTFPIPHSFIILEKIKKS